MAGIPTAINQIFIYTGKCLCTGNIQNCFPLLDKVDAKKNKDEQCPPNGNQDSVGSNSQEGDGNKVHGIYPVLNGKYKNLFREYHIPFLPDITVYSVASVSSVSSQRTPRR